jgi:hypothetical protein
MKRFILLVFIAALLQGCASSSQTFHDVYYKNGYMGYKISCDQASDCLEDAGQICRERGFAIVSQCGYSKGCPSIDYAAGSGNKVAMYIRCK